MGLDMYLEAHRFVSGSEHADKDEQATNRLIVSALEMEDMLTPKSPFITVEVTVAYWRKANAIHKWFVDNCADKVDDCRPVYVSGEQLLELRTKCQYVLAHPEEASEVLPAQDGFFFGGTEYYDEWYFRTLSDTIAQIDRVLAAKSDFDELFYRASW